MAATAARPKASTVGVAWRCFRCRKYLGRIVGDVLHEANGDRSLLPCLRVCPDCRHRNVRAPD